MLNKLKEKLKSKTVVPKESNKIGGGGMNSFLKKSDDKKLNIV